MFDPDALPDEEMAGEASDEGVPSFGPLSGEGASEPVAPEPASMLPALATSSYSGDEIPPDNEHGDGVRNPIQQPCAGIKGNGLLTPKVFSKAEDWRDYNYSDFSY